MRMLQVEDVAVEDVVVWRTVRARRAPSRAKTMAPVAPTTTIIAQLRPAPPAAATAVPMTTEPARAAELRTMITDIRVSCRRPDRVPVTGLRTSASSHPPAPSRPARPSSCQPPAQVSSTQCRCWTSGDPSSRVNASRVTTSRPRIRRSRVIADRASSGTKKTRAIRTASRRSALPPIRLSAIGGRPVALPFPSPATAASASRDESASPTDPKRPAHHSHLDPSLGPSPARADQLVDQHNNAPPSRAKPR